jgi:hypothetical protein
VQTYNNKYPCDRFKVDGGVVLDDDRQNLAVCIRDSCIQPVGAPCKPPCAVAVDAGAGTRCAACMNEKCAAQMIPVCEDRSSGSVFDKAQDCAEYPGVGPSDYHCKPLRTVDGGAMTGTAIETLEHNFLVCVRDQCMDGNIAPCKTCPLQPYLNKYPLDASACGACILSQCEEPFMGCCANDPTTTDGKLVHEVVATCGFPDGPPPACKGIVSIDAGADAGCLYDLPQCVRQSCASACGGS